MAVEVDYKELLTFEKNLSRVPELIETSMEIAFTKTANQIVELARLYKPDLKYAGGYRTGELNRSYVIESKGGKVREVEIRNEAQHFNSVEAGSTSSNVLLGYFNPGWRTGSGKAMFVTGDDTGARFYQMNPWKGFFMLKKATESSVVGEAHSKRVADSVEKALSKALGG